MSTAQLLALCVAIQQAITDLQNYFSNFLTVQTFGGDYMYQRLVGMQQAITTAIADLQASTPNMTDAQTQCTTVQSMNNDLLDYDSRFMTIQNYGGEYLSYRLSLINTNVGQVLAGL